MALVTQETFLFNDTVWANIAMGNPGASKEEILKAAEAAHVDNFIKTWMTVMTPSSANVG